MGKERKKREEKVEIMLNYASEIKKVREGDGNKEYKKRRIWR